jgi:hypothetical protein
MNTESENPERREEVLSEDPSPGRPDTPTDESTQSLAQGKTDLVSDPNYPNDEILVKVADKLLKSFEKR